jgi:hypothetical protein
MEATKMQVNEMQVIERGIVYSDPDPQSPTRVAAYPSLARLSNGRILCAFHVGTSKSGADESVRIAESCDEGQSWQVLPFVPETELNGVRGSISFAHLLETAPGELLLVSVWINRENPDLPISHPETGGCLELRLVKSHSQDGGRSWSKLEEVTTVPFPQPEVSGPPIKLSQPGHLLLPMENQKFYDDPNPIDEKCYALLSFDGGKTWPSWAMIAHDHPARKFWCNRVAKLPSGKLMCVSWTFDNATEQDLPLHLAEGSPDGRTWSTPFSTGINGQVSYLFAQDESTLLMATSHRESPAGIRLRASTDGGRTWNGNGLLVFDAEDQASQSGGNLAEYYNYMTNYSFGWSPMLRLEDGSVLLVHFAGSGDAINICYAKIK